MKPRKSSFLNYSDVPKINVHSLFEDPVTFMRSVKFWLKNQRTPRKYVKDQIAEVDKIFSGAVGTRAYGAPSINAKRLSKVIKENLPLRLKTDQLLTNLELLGALNEIDSVEANNVIQALEMIFEEDDPEIMSIVFEHDDPAWMSEAWMKSSVFEDDDPAWTKSPVYKSQGGSVKRKKSKRRRSKQKK
jgi:hypothetical protein